MLGDALLAEGLKGLSPVEAGRCALGVSSPVQAPFEYESRLVEMFPGVFRHLRLKALDPYDHALTKLERNIERDRSDVQHLAHTVPFDLNVLRERYTAEQRLECPAVLP